MRANSCAQLGAVWGVALAVAFTGLSLLAVPLGWLSGADPISQHPSTPLLLAWWIATPVCSAVAGRMICLFRTLTGALLVATACALPWVLAIHTAARGRVPADVGDWTGVLARTGALGVAVGVLVWRTLLDLSVRRETDGRGAGEIL